MDGIRIGAIEYPLEAGTCPKINNIPLTDFKTIQPTQDMLEIKHIFESTYDLPYIEVNLIPNDIVKGKEFPYIDSDERQIGWLNKKSLLIYVGRIGWADLENNAVYVVESDDGSAVTMRTLIHELLHFVYGSHPWPEELENDL